MRRRVATIASVLAIVLAIIGFWEAIPVAVLAVITLVRRRQDTLEEFYAQRAWEKDHR